MAVGEQVTFNLSPGDGVVRIGAGANLSQAVTVEAEYLFTSLAASSRLLGGDLSGHQDVHALGVTGLFSINLSPMRDASEAVSSVVIVMNDITETSLIQAKLMNTEKLAAVGTRHSHDIR